MILDNTLSVIQCRIIISSLITRSNDNLNTKITTTNNLSAYLSSKNNWLFINHININKSHLNASGLHLNTRGTFTLARNLIDCINYWQLDINLDIEVNLNISNQESISSSIHSYPKLKGFKIGHLNIASLPKHLDELTIVINELSFDIFTINETRLHDSFDDRDIGINGYDIIRRDRNRHGGGVSIYIRDNIPYIQRYDLPVQDLETICIEIKKT